MQLNLTFIPNEIMTTKNIEFKLLGVILFLSGISIIIHPTYYSSKYSLILDYSEIKWLLGLSMSVMGAFFFMKSIKTKLDTFMCSKCENLYKRAIGKPWKCPSCKSNLIKLEGFYESDSINVSNRKV